jgi:hypothetical protein
VQLASFGRGCEGADSIRDEAAFFDQCLPAMDALSCTDLRAGNAPESCTDQIEYRL